MVIGVVTLPKKNTKKLTLQKIFGCISVQKVMCPENPFDLLVAKVPYNEEKLRRKSPSKVKKITAKAERKLVKKGAEEIVFCNFIADLLREKEICEYSSGKKETKELFLKYAPLCIRQTAAEMGINLFESRICIRDSKMERISEYLINRLCFDVKKLILITENIQRAREVCEKFYDETGFLVDVRDGCTHRFDVLIDVDGGCVRFGSDLAVQGADMGYNLFGYDICQLEVAVAAKDTERLPQGWIFDHKKYVDFIR